MKKFFLIICFIIMLFLSCQKKSEDVFLKFERLGGGDILFNCKKMDNSNYQILVIRYSFKEIGLQFLLNKNDNLEVFNLIDDILNKKINIDGNIEQEKGLTGTWVHIFVVKDNKEIEIKNKQLIEKFRIVEDFVRNTVEKEFK
jgi:thioredoxin-related protein